MRVIAYTHTKRTLAVHLSIETIVELGIDPWRLDLFDPEPVMLPGREPFYFRKLRDVFFAYKPHGSSTFVVGMHDGDAAVAFEAAEYELKREQWRLSGLKISEQSFPTHLAEYLRLFERSNEIEVQLDPPIDNDAPIALLPKPFGAVRVQGSTVTFQQGAAIGGNRNINMRRFPMPQAHVAPPDTSEFAGVMLDSLHVPILLPDTINWVFEAFGNWQPQVVGNAVVAALISAETHGIQCILTGATDVESIVRTVPGIGCIGRSDSATTFLKDGVCYSVHPQIPLWKKKKTPLSLSACTVFSANANQVQGPRIAFSDVGNRKARKLCQFECHTGERSFQSSFLTCEGFELLELAGTACEPPQKAMP